MSSTLNRAARAPVLGFGRHKLDMLVDPDDVLTVAVEDGRVRLG